MKHSVWKSAENVIESWDETSRFLCSSEQHITFIWYCLEGIIFKISNNFHQYTDTHHKNYDESIISLQVEKKREKLQYFMHFDVLLLLISTPHFQCFLIELL